LVDAEKPFRYYGDFKNAQFNLIEPKSCPISGSTNIKIYGQGFKSRNVPARLSSPLRDRNQKEEEEKGTTNVKTAFDGRTFLDTKIDFYF